MPPEIAIALALLGRPAEAQQSVPTTLPRSIGIPPGAILGPVVERARPPILWWTDYTRAMTERARTGKPLLVAFSMDPCVWCDKMHAGPISENEETLRRFVLCKVDGPSHPGLLKDFLEVGYEIKGYPSYIVVAGDQRGTICRLASGYMDARTFMAMLTAAESRHKQLLPQPAPLPPVVSGEPRVVGY